MMFKNHRAALFAFCLAIVLCFSTLLFTVKHYCYILVWGQQASDPAFISYRLDDARRLVIGRDVALLINIREQVVLSLSPSFGRKLGPVVFWPRDSTRGVVLGDPDKGSVEDGYRFGERGVSIQYSDGYAQHDLHVPL
jgi:hypothetical protein